MRGLANAYLVESTVCQIGAPVIYTVPSITNIASSWPVLLSSPVVLAGTQTTSARVESKAGAPGSTQVFGG